MNFTFGNFLNLIENKNSKKLDAIRSGNNIRNPNCGNFWDDFIHLCGNAEGMAELLDVPKEKVTGWAGRISDSKKEVENQDSNKVNKKNRIIKNGEL